MPRGPGSENDFRAEGEQKHAALQAHGFGHGENQLVAFDCRDERETDSGVAAGGLDEDGFARMDFSFALGLGNHADADAIFHTAKGILAFEFRHNICDAACGDFIQAHQRSVADEFGNVLCDFQVGSCLQH